MRIVYWLVDLSPQNKTEDDKVVKKDNIKLQYKCVCLCCCGGILSWVAWCPETPTVPRVMGKLYYTATEPKDPHQTWHCTKTRLEIVPILKLLQFKSSRQIKAWKNISVAKSISVVKPLSVGKFSADMLLCIGSTTAVFWPNRCVKVAGWQLPSSFMSQDVIWLTLWPFCIKWLS